MILAITLALLGLGTLGCALWSANTGDKVQRIITEILACVGILALCTLIGCTIVFPDQNTAEAAKISEGEQEQKLDIVPVDTDANITITTESLTNEQLIKAFIDKWDGVLPDTIIIYGADQYEHND